MTNYNDGKWHEWSGGECPVHPKTVVDFVTDDGIISSWTARMAKWDYKPVPIRAFRVIKEYKEPREFWVGTDNGYHTIQSYEPRRPHNFIYVREVLE